jgi:CHAT domain-containing protein
VWEGTGFGVSEAKANFTALPSVRAELHAIFRQNETETGPIAGAIRLKGEFTRASIENDLRTKRNSVVHIATHFDSQPGVAANSHLLLGDGSILSLADIEDQQDLFDGVDLLTLSACSTAFTSRSEDGREVDSFGTIAQRLGAKGVIASLWSVSDEANLAADGNYVPHPSKQPELGKSEALRPAQEQMASGSLKPQANDAKDRGVQVLSRRRGADPWTHPYYWHRSFSSETGSK